MPMLLVCAHSGYPGGPQKLLIASRQRRARIILGSRWTRQTAWRILAYLSHRVCAYRECGRREEEEEVWQSRMEGQAEELARCQAEIDQATRQKEESRGAGPLEIGITNNT
ncbi:hypothetical protein BDR07DRAFT_1377046 [Suillus spraguei]|nr:hypothetical protein BDR07DRAFT_1377046 [Suillus spraguei]